MGALGVLNVIVVVIVGERGQIINVAGNIGVGEGLARASGKAHSRR